jgi:geranylgeranyl diphosphate synthase type II
VVNQSDDDVRTVLADYGNRARKAVIDAVPVKEPRRELYDLVLAHLATGGKQLRPAIALATCGALGGDVDRALPLGAAVELLHAAFLVHDDIEDASRRRRGRPTLHEAHGVALAINVGDALATLAAREMGRAARAYRNEGIAAVEEFNDVVQQTIEGQAIELGWRDRVASATDADYLEIVLRKTAGYTMILPLRLGALAATGKLPRRGRFERFGFFLGALFQIRDDMRNLWPDDEPNGKQLGEDIIEGKLTLMIAHTLRVAPPEERDSLQEVLGNPSITREQLMRAIETIERHGGLRYAHLRANALAGAARNAFDTAFASVPESRDLAFLRDLPQFLLNG